MAVLAPALITFRAELNTRWPGRDKRTDGWIGNLAHAVTGMPENGGSDHNPNRRNVVDALDIDVDGIDCPEVVAAACRHPSTEYVIWNRKIRRRSKNFVAENYTGSNPHTDHLHVSLTQSAQAENNTTPWRIAGGVIPAVNPGQASGWAQRLADAMPVLRQSTGTRGSARKLQTLLNLLLSPQIEVDGVFGPATAGKVRLFQTARELAVDGIVGPITWRALIEDPTTVQREDMGYDVRRVQSLINVADMWLASGTELGVDGVFGPATEAAVRQYQTRQGLGVDGIVGPLTWTALLTR